MRFPLSTLAVAEVLFDSTSNTGGGHVGPGDGDGVGVGVGVGVGGTVAVGVAVAVDVGVGLGVPDTQTPLTSNTQCEFGKLMEATGTGEGRLQAVALI